MNKETYYVLGNAEEGVFLSIMGVRFFTFSSHLINAQLYNTQEEAMEDKVFLKERKNVDLDIIEVEMRVVE